MKKSLFMMLAMLMLTSMSVATMNAQTIVKGDMNDDGTVDVSDVTMTVSTILGNIPLQTISLAGNPFEVDNTLVVGTWYAPDGTNFTLSEDGTTTFPGASTYKFRPTQGTLMFYNASGRALNTLVLNEVESSYLLAVDYATGAYIYYTNQSALATGISLDQTTLAMNSGTTAQLTATVTPEDAFGADFTWTSSDESVATVDANGLVTAVACGMATITATAGGSNVKATCSVTVTQMVTNITLSQTSVALELDAFVRLSATVLPENAANKNITWSSSNEDVATVRNGRVDAYGYGTAIITCAAQDGSGVTAICRINVLKNIPEYVDLGLSSGTLWATCNIGAESPEEYGDYFAWGEVEPRTDNAYSWGSYKWCEFSETTLTKYCSNSSYGNEGFTDVLTELELADDAAYMNWSDEWRMPSKDQLEELINSSYTTTEWTTLNGVNGCKITSNSNGSSIFLPAAGYRDSTPVGHAGSICFYWSRTLNSDRPCYAWYLDYRQKSMNMYNAHRFVGRSVRPVRLSE